MVRPHRQGHATQTWVPVRLCPHVLEFTSSSLWFLEAGTATVRQHSFTLMVVSVLALLGLGQGPCLREHVK